MRPLRIARKEKQVLTGQNQSNKWVRPLVPIAIIVVASIVLLYIGGNVLKAMYPDLIHMQILVTFPN